MKPSESVENYLKAIYELEEEQGRATTTALAERLKVASPSATAMIKRMSRAKPPLVDYESHKGVTLTGEGRSRALETIRHHRLLETFLVQALGYSWDEVHAEAERLEHHISEHFEERIAEYLGHPQYDPHGAPIPAVDGSIPRSIDMPLPALKPGQRGRVLRVHNDTSDELRYLISLGIEPNQILTLVKKSPFDGPVYVRVGDGEEMPVHAIGPGIASMVIVERE